MKKISVDENVMTEKDKLRLEHDFSEFEKKSQILRESNKPFGKGGYSEVYFGKTKQMMRLALKVSYLKENVEEHKRNQYESSIKNEANITANLRHKNCIRAFGMYKEAHTTFVVLECALNKDLSFLTSLFYKQQLFQIRKGNSNIMHHLSENLIKFFMTQVIDSLNYLREMNAVHNDLKLENILLMKNFQAKLADFALTAVLPQAGDYILSSAGTAVYMAPELQSDRRTVLAKDAFKIDYYSLAIMIHKMFYNEFIIKPNEKKMVSHSDLIKKLKEIAEKRENYFNKDGRKMSDDLLFLMLKLLDPNIETRSDLSEIKTSKWVKKDQEFLKNKYEENPNDVMKFLLEMQKSNSSKYMMEKSEEYEIRQNNIFTEKNIYISKIKYEKNELPLRRILPVEESKKKRILEKWQKDQFRVRKYLKVIRN
jgi:serine/threonine protein kinase